MKKFRPALLIAKIVAITLICFSSLESYAVKAYPGIVEARQPDGSILKVKIFGDEYFNYMTTEDGHIIAKGRDGYLYFADYNTGKLKISSQRAIAGQFGFMYSKEVPQAIIDAERAKNFSSSFGRTRSIKKPTQPRNIIVILAQYQDVKFLDADPQKSFDDMLNKKGYNRDGATGSVADYYAENSFGKYTPKFHVAPPVTLAQNRDFYTETMDRAKVQTEEACTLADNYVNFADFDEDEDGEIDVILVYYAGNNKAESDVGVWPHNSSLKGNLYFDGKRSYLYSCTSELQGSGTKFAGIGTSCHEFGHVLGFVDVYDTKNSIDASRAMWERLSLMDKGNYNNSGNTPPNLTSLERMVAGWLEPVKIKSTGNFTLKSIENNEAYMIETENPGEYFLIENRQPRGWDTHIATSGDNPKGMLILHIDRSKSVIEGLSGEYKWNENLMNTVKHHQCIDLVEATGHEGVGLKIQDILFPGTKNVTTLDNWSTPNNKPWSGGKLGVDIYDIKLTNDIISFRTVYTQVDQTKAYIMGTVTNLMDKPISNAKVRLYKQTAAPKSTVFNNSIFSEYLNTKAGTPDYETTSDNIGRFDFVNIPEGDYMFEIVATGYVTHEFNKAMYAGVNTYNAKINPSSDNPESYTLRWHNSVTSGFFGHTTGNPLYAAVKFASSDLQKYTLEGISAVSVVVKGASKGKLTLKSGDKVIGSAEETVTNGGNMLFNLERLFLKKDNSKDLMVELAITDYDKTAGIIGVDESVPTVQGKGNLVSENGQDWLALDGAYRRNGNFMISLILGKYSTSPYYTLITDKVSYSVNETIKIQIRNLKGDEQGIKYQMGSMENTTGEFKVPVNGEHTIKAIVKKSNGSEETLIKVITAKAK